MGKGVTKLPKKTQTKTTTSVAYTSPGHGMHAHLAASKML